MNYFQTAVLLSVFLVCPPLPSLLLYGCLPPFLSQRKLKGVMLDTLKTFEKVSGPSTQFVSFSCLVRASQYDLFTAWAVFPILVVVVPGSLTLYLYLKRRREKANLMSGMVQERDRRFSLGVDAEETEKRIATLHAICTGGQLPENSSDGVTTEQGDVASIVTGSDELALDALEANAIIGEEEEGFGGALRAAAYDQQLAAAEAAARKELVRTARRMEKAEHLAEKDCANIVQMLESGDKAQMTEARRRLRKIEREFGTTDTTAMCDELDRLEQAGNDGPLQEPSTKTLVWKEKTSKTHDKTYWRNAETGESVWIKPQEIEDFEAKVEAWNNLKMNEYRRNLSSAGPQEQSTADTFRMEDTALVEPLPPSKIASRRRWNIIRQIITEGVRQKQEKRKNFERKITTTKEAKGTAMARCHICNADFAILMCRECGTTEKAEYEARFAEMRENMFSICNDEALVRLYEEYNEHPYQYTCQYCDKVVHAPKGKKNAHVRLKIRRTQNKDAVDSSQIKDGNLRMLHKREMKASAETVFFCTVLIVVFIAFPTLIREIAYMTRCVEVPSTGKSFLKTDMDIACSDPGYATWKTAAVAFFFCYGAGIPTIAFSLLSYMAGADGTGLLRKKTIASFGFLYSGYRLKRYEAVKS